MGHGWSSPDEAPGPVPESYMRQAAAPESRQQLREEKNIQPERWRRAVGGENKRSLGQKRAEGRRNSVAWKGMAMTCPKAKAS